MDRIEANRRSWNVATQNHNRHKGDQAARLAQGEDILFPEELGLLPDLEGRRLVHLQCNAGQDSLCLARRGAEVTGVDLSDEAVRFASELAEAAKIPARFERAEVLSWMAATDARFSVAFSSYGVVGWLPDIQAWARGIHRVLEPGGCFVYVDFHPLVWSLAGEAPFAPTQDDYFQTSAFESPVNDYVAESGTGLGAVDGGPALPNAEPAYSWQYGLGQIVSALVGAGLQLEVLEEYPHANGCRLLKGLVEGPGRQWCWPAGQPRLPLMFGLRVRKPAARRES